MTRIGAAPRLAISFFWGIVATSPYSIAAAIPFGISALICNFLALPALSIFLPSMIIGAGITIIAADIFSRVKKHNRIKEWYSLKKQKGENITEESIKNLEEAEGWLSCGDRNSFGYVFCHTPVENQIKDNEGTHRPIPSPHPDLRQRKYLTRSKSMDAILTCSALIRLQGENNDAINISQSPTDSVTVIADKTKSALITHSFTIKMNNNEPLPRSQSCDSFFSRLVVS